ncbi:terpene cyclase/mutase family protein [Mesorhizobium sp. VK22B]|uniref:Terpene cyclase/mutase family protein n=1 Tax=Mesorhizobium captivum TaxID=3072319 RepID=A0ABU4ZA48_9HYPH|nr:prenyltransferase/squalene oxidase repeat-containing protein [Mesorhizobium sp. VK22B]MDX8496165.1 terpene cyclase/mutase family protein [Mesorhizobium sp. VK22B]
MTRHASELRIPAPDLSPEQIKLFNEKITIINVANEARRALNFAEMHLIQFSVARAISGDHAKDRRKINKQLFLETLDKHPAYVEDTYAAVCEPALKIGITLRQFLACVSGIKRSLQSGKEPRNRLRALIHEKWQEAESAVDQLPASFRKTILGAYVMLTHDPGLIEFLQEFRSNFHRERSASIDAILKLLASYPIIDILGRRYFEAPLNYAAYDIVRDIAPASNVEFLTNLEEQVSLDLSEWVNSWRSFLDNPISRPSIPGPRPHYIGPNPPTRDVAMHLYLLCSNRSLRERFRTPLLELCQIAVRMQEGSGAWTDAFSVPLESGSFSVRDDCTFSTIFMVLALHEMTDSVDYSNNIEKAVKWLVKAQQTNGSFADTNSIYNNSACLTILACSIFDKLAKGAEGSIDRAHAYLLSTQNSFGFWSGSKPLGEFDVTTCALRYLLGRQRRENRLGHWGQSSLRFQSIAEDTLARGDVTAAKLAVIASYHGVEFALYDVISRFPNGNIYANDSSDRTLGVREAKARLRDLARDIGLLDQKKDLPHSMQISQHASLRGNIVHRNQDVDQSSAQRTIETSRKFIEAILSYQP